MMSEERLIAALGADAALALSDDDRNGTSDPGVLVQVLDDAEQEVREAVALGGYPRESELGAALEDAAVTLAIERLFHRRREMIPGVWSDRADRARTILREIAARRRTIPHLRRSDNAVPSPPEQLGLHRRRTLGHL